MKKTISSGARRVLRMTMIPSKNSMNRYQIIVIGSRIAPTLPILCPQFTYLSCPTSSETNVWGQSVIGVQMGSYNIKKMSLIIIIQLV